MTSKIELTPTQQAAAVDRIAENIALLSGAGCGKTYVLARRFTELLLAGDEQADPLSRFVALTFTEKAALEMSARVRKMLDDFAAAKSEDRGRLLGWLTELPEARISTIHSFCASLLRAYAVEAGIDPAFGVCADQLVADKMLADAAEQAVIGAVEAQRQDVCGALTLISFERLVRHVIQLVRWRTDWQRADYDDPAATLKRWQDTQATQRRRVQDALATDPSWKQLAGDAKSLTCGDPDDKLAQSLALVLKFAAGPASVSAGQIDGLSEKLGRTGLAKNWGGKEAMARARSVTSAAVKRMKQTAPFFEQFGDLDKQAAEALATITSLAEQAELIYARQKRRRGLLDFTDLLAAADKLLTDKPALREAIAGQIDQLLIDEAQDTDGFQLALLERLMFGRAGGKSLPPGRLFVIGDAKQSIYRFRGAQVEVFEDLCSRLGPGQQEKLSISFRTHAAGAGFVNHLFAPLMGKAYERIEAHRTACPPGPSVEVLLASAGDQPIANAKHATDLQAQVTAQRIAEIIASRQELVWDQAGQRWRAPQYGDIAVLFGRMTNSLAYERRLAEAGIGYYVVAGTGFFQQQEIFDVLNALRAVDNPFDDIAFFGLLRSSMIGLDDNALMFIAEAMDPPYLPKLIDSGAGAAVLTGEQSDALAFAVDLLDELHKAKDAVGIDELIRQILHQTGFEAVLLAQPHGKRLLGNVRQLVQRARSASDEGMTLSDFIAQANELVIDQARYEQANVSAEAGNVVRLMTIHKAKGLEFPIVIIPDINAGRRGSNAALLNNGKWGLTLKLTDDQDTDNGPEAPVSYRLAKAHDDALDVEEFIRRMYVAVTRHKDHLVMVGADWRTKEGRFREARSFLVRLDEVLDLSGALESGRDQIEYDDGRYRAIVKAVRPSPPAATAKRATPGKRMLDAAETGSELAAGITGASAGADELPLVGPLRANIAKARLSVTALCDFRRCQMLYRWRHQLLTPPLPAAGKGDSTRSTPDPAMLGTIYHRCMELLDFADPQPASALVAQALDELAPAPAPSVDELSAELDEMLRRFRQHELHGRICAARQVFRELDFVTRTGSGTLTGKIDLLYRGSDDRWHVVDYKSDRVAKDELAAHAQSYQLQMLCYAGAAANYLSAPPESAELYFLRPGQAYAFDTKGPAIRQAARQVEALAEQLVTVSRTGNYERKTTQSCQWCPFGALCAQIRC